VVTEFPLSALLEEQLSYVQNGRRQNGCCMLGFRLSIFYWWDSLLYLTHTHTHGVFYLFNTYMTAGFCRNHDGWIFCYFSSSASKKITKGANLAKILFDSTYETRQTIGRRLLNWT